MQNLIESVPAFASGVPPLVPTAVIEPVEESSLPVCLCPMVVRANEGIYSDLGGYGGFLKLDEQSTGGAFILLDVRCNPGSGVPPHIHRLEDEIFHVLEGRFQIQVGTCIYEAGPGDTVFAPRHVAHSWLCASVDEGRLIIIVTPGANFQGYLLEMAQNAQMPSHVMQDPASIDAFMVLTERYGMTMLPAGIEGTPQQVGISKGTFVSLGDHRGPFDVSSRDSNGVISLLNMEVDFRGGPPPHIHAQEDETFVIVRGRFRALLGETILEVGPGDIIFAPRGHQHGWQCLSEEGGHALVLATPGENFEIFAHKMSEGQLMPPIQPGAMEKLLVLSEQHHLTILPPIW